jgi:hypothetical protein
LAAARSREWRGRRRANAVAADQDATVLPARTNGSSHKQANPRKKVQCSSAASCQHFASLKEEETFMRIATLAFAGVLAACIATPTLAKHHEHKSAPTLQKTQPAGEDADPYAPGQQRYRTVRHKKS